ncbi:MAG: FtsX-like permease family protein [Spirochaetota bacterium]
MKFLLQFAWKNLSRYRKRTIITASAIAVGLAAFIYIDSMLAGTEKESERNLIWYETSSSRIVTEKYWEERDKLPLKYSLTNVEKAESILKEMKIPYAPRVTFAAELIVRKEPFREDGSIQVKVSAIDPQKDDAVFRFKETVEEGRYLNQGEQGALMGAWLAEDLGAQAGYPITLVTRTKNGYFQTIDVTISGIVNCPNPYINRGTIFIPLDIADALLQMEDTVTEIDLRFPELSDVAKLSAEVEERLKKELPDTRVVTWKDLAQDYIQLAGAKQGGTKVILLLVFIIAAVGISNTMLMAIYERVREIGMLRALGMKDSDIRLSILLEAGGIGMLGSAIGTAVGILLNAWLINTGIDFSFFMRQMNVGYRVAGIIRGVWNPGTIITALILGIILSMLIAFIPARKATSMEITDALRHQ